MRASIWRPTLIATLVCGILDAIYPTALTLLRGRDPAAMWRGVASGPFPGASEWGAAGSALGLATHFVLMAIMVVVFMLAARRLPSLLDRPILSGVAYGLITYVVMNLIVVSLRFGSPLPPAPVQIASQLFAHIVLVGLPMAFIARRYLRG